MIKLFHDEPVQDFIHAHHRMADRFTDVWLWMWTMVLTPFADFFIHLINKYLFTDWDFLKWLLILMFIDLLTGIWKSLAKKQVFTSRGMRMTLSKIIQYTFFLIVIHVLMHFRIDGREVGYFSWLDDYAFTFLMCIEAKSIYENLNEVKRLVDIKDMVVEALSNLFSNLKKK